MNNISHGCAVWNFMNNKNKNKKIKILIVSQKYYTNKFIKIDKTNKL